MHSTRVNRKRLEGKVKKGGERLREKLVFRMSELVSVSNDGQRIEKTVPWSAGSIEHLGKSFLIHFHVLSTRDRFVFGLTEMYAWS